MQIQLRGTWCKTRLETVVHAMMVGLGRLLSTQAVNAKCLHRFKERLDKRVWRRAPLWITQYRKHIGLRKFSKLKAVGDQEITQGIKSSSPVSTLLWHSLEAGDRILAKQSP